MTHNSLKLSFITTLFLCCVQGTLAQEKAKSNDYDFRNTDAFRNLPETSRTRLETVAKDLSRLERALDSFMDEHQGAPPERLEELVPKYLERLPEDPFFDSDEKIPDYLRAHQRSLDGRGYLYRFRPKGTMIKSYDPLELEPSPGAWEVRSIGLRDFPFRYSKSNPGLFRSRGYWGRFQLDVF